MLVMIACLALALLRSGGMAFSPGRLSAKQAPGKGLAGFESHAAFETQCSRCHAPLETTQDVLCQQCHQRIKHQIAQGEGIHARIEAVNRCAACHSEHQGRGFDPGKAALQDFDHGLTDFSLVKHQVDYQAAPVECSACHQVGAQFSLNQAGCLECHRAQSSETMRVHTREFGRECVDCHDGSDRIADLDHQSTDFPLTGQHAGLRCAACHGTQANDSLARVGLASQASVLDSFSQTPRECSGCHQQPGLHEGVFSKDCAACHDTNVWSPALWQGDSFEHNLSTGFSLVQHSHNWDGRAITCRDCHQADVTRLDVQGCIECHSKDSDGAEFMHAHQQRFGLECTSCHDGADRMHDFEHANVFPLNGVHERIECEACHIDRVFTGTPTNCADCHAEPQIHAGFFGLRCQLCHGEQAWAPASLQQHDFPLDHGGQDEIACEVCHRDTYVEYTCFGCHEHQADLTEARHIELRIPFENLAACAQCHPNGVGAVPESTEGGD